MIKRVRPLYRVSSSQQLDTDGDLKVQKGIVIDFIKKQKGWTWDGKEYFEGSKSGYKTAVKDRDVLLEAYEDAKNKEYDILVAYKDDRIGRRMWEVGGYVMSLKSCGVDIYTVKDGCISPESDDIMGQMVLALRYANAQKSSSDTGMRVKDTAQKLAAQGKFMGGAAPYGYKLELSGEISKHGRALKHLVIVPERAEVVRFIYQMSLMKEYGSMKIAKELNCHEKYKMLAPKDVWKGGTITSILTNPIYTGHSAYKRRERKGDHYRTLDSEEWIVSKERDESIAIIDDDTWDKVQQKRKQRSQKYLKKPENINARGILRNDGILPLVDVAHCGYCGSKLVNGSKYNYWTIKDTGERRAKKIPMYKCQNVWQGVPHDVTGQYKAEFIEPIVFESLTKYVEKLMENENILSEIEKNQNQERRTKEKELEKEKLKLKKIREDIQMMEGKIPDAMRGEYPLSLEDLVGYIQIQKDKEQEQMKKIQSKKDEISGLAVSAEEWEELCRKMPSWKNIFMEADGATKRVLVDKIIERIDVTASEIKIKFKINLENFLVQPRMSNDGGTTPYTPDLV